MNPPTPVPGVKSPRLTVALSVTGCPRTAGLGDTDRVVNVGDRTVRSSRASRRGTKRAAGRRRGRDASMAGTPQAGGVGGWWSAGGRSPGGAGREGRGGGSGDRGA